MGGPPAGVRLTVQFDDRELYRAFRYAAAERGQTLGQAALEAIREWVARHEAQADAAALVPVATDPTEPWSAVQAALRRAQGRPMDPEPEAALVTRSARHDLLTLPPVASARVEATITALLAAARASALPAAATPLAGSASTYGLDVNEYRVLFARAEPAGRITILRTRHRRHAYGV